MTMLLIASADGLRQLELDTSTGEASTLAGPIAPANSLSLTADPEIAGVTWAVSLEPEGAVQPVFIDDNGLRLGAPAASGGEVPCHTGVVAADGAARTVAVANYSGHTVGFSRYEDATDSAAQVTPGPVVHFGDESNPHQVLRVGDRLLISDLGLDCLHVLTLDGQVAGQIALEPGAGPRNAVQVDETHLVVALEGANAAVLVSLDRDAAGHVAGGSQVSRVAFDGDPEETHPSQILQDSSGAVRILNRGSQRLCTLEVTGSELQLVAEHTVPDWPMDLLEVDGVLLVACRDADTLIALEMSAPDRELFRVAIPKPIALAVI